MKRLILFVAISMVFSVVTFADIAKPVNPKEKSTKALYETTLDIRLKADAKDAMLVIPKSQVKQLRAQLEALDDGSENTAAVISGSGFSGLQTIVSGLFLSLAIIIGGIWFIRSGKNTPNKGVIAAILLSCVASASIVYANAGPPPEARSITGKMFSQAMHIYGFGWGKIKVETTDEETDRITLIVPNPKTSASPGEE